jgi:hypothetical protein
MNDEQLAAALADAEKRRNGPVPDNPDEALKQLAELLHLDSVDVRIVSVRMFGQGATASLDIDLDNGETMRFDSLRDMVRPQTLMCELVACTGATPTLKQPQAMRVVALARSIAGRLRTLTEDDIATDWGLQYLQGAERIDFDMQDQTERYAAFEQLDQRDPWFHARALDLPLEKASIVLRDTTGVQLVRADWFGGWVRGVDPRMTPKDVERPDGAGRLDAPRARGAHQGDRPGKRQGAYLGLLGRTERLVDGK